MHRLPRSRGNKDGVAQADHLYLARSRSARPLPRGLTGHVALPSPSIETRSLLALTRVLPPISTFRFAHLCRSRPRGSIRSLSTFAIEQPPLQR
jgi:hypothetical protein